MPSTAGTKCISCSIFYFLAVLNNGLNLAAVKPFVSNYVNGAAVIAGVALAMRLQRRRVT